MGDDNTEYTHAEIVAVIHDVKKDVREARDEFRTYREAWDPMLPLMKDVAAVGRVGAIIGKVALWVGAVSAAVVATAAAVKGGFK